MKCNIVKDLIPLYIDGCCSKESETVIREHMEHCVQCKHLYEEMKAPSQVVSAPSSPVTFRKLNDWKASVLQSVLLFLSFALITVGVTLESKTPLGPMNAYWALNLIIPATGFMLSLASWYFVRIYKNRRVFSNCTTILTLLITLCGYAWSAFHYGINPFSLFGAIGIVLTVVFCVCSKLLSNRYAKMLGKE